MQTSRSLAILLAAACGSDPGGSDCAGQPGGCEVAASLDGLRWELPCVADTTATLCTTGAAVMHTATLAGEPGVTYDIELRFRGIVEPKTYVGGTRDGFWQLGGSPGGDTANVYRLSISEPSQVYYVNAGTTRSASELFCDAIDFTRTIQAKTGAVVTLSADPLDALQIQNLDENGAPHSIPDVAPAPSTFDGQFVQMDVVSVTAR